jgi:hypothetical protein
VDAVRAIGLGVIHPAVTVDEYAIPIRNYLDFVYRNKACADITLRVKNFSTGETRDYPSHIMILMSRVEYFDRCVTEGSLTPKQVFEFPHPVPDFCVFELFLEWIYTNELSSVFTPSPQGSQPEDTAQIKLELQFHLWHLFFLAQSIDLGALSDLVQHLICFHLTKFNAIDILRALQSFSAHILFSKTLQHLSQSTFQFTEPEVPEDLLKYFIDYNVIQKTPEPQPAPEPHPDVAFD